MSNIAYNIAEQVTISTLENGVEEEFGYDAARMQITTQGASKSATTYLDLDYDYEAAAGEMGASTTAGNAGQLMGISGTIDSQSESAAYTYDNVGRLKTSSQTTNSVTAKRQFDYDRWGNRTAVWDTSPKTPVQLQSVSLVESSSIPTNQIESVTENSATVNYTYDAAGNVTDDDVNTFVYDAENRLVSINSGAEQYKYDHQNRRVAKTVGSVTTQYVWEGSKVIAEHAASSGNVLVDYIFMGSRMVKKVEGSTTRYIVSDRLSARMMLDEDYDVVGKQSHLPFGEAMATSGEQDKHKFTSYERDTSTGLDYAVNRWHSSEVGRFLQADPYRASAGAEDPQSWNRYRYSRNDPVNKVDPLGLEELCLVRTTLTFYTGLNTTYVSLNIKILVCWTPGGGSGGSGGNSGGQLPKPIPSQEIFKQYRKQFKKFLDEGSDSCVQNLNRYIPELKNAIDNVTFFDLDSQYNGRTLGDDLAFFYVPNIPAQDTSTETLHSWFLRLAIGPAGTPRALTLPNGWGPRPGIYFYSSETNFVDFPRLLMHELMHTIVTTGQGSLDQRLAAALGINVPQGQNAGDVVSDWFSNGCQ